MVPVKKAGASGYEMRRTSAKRFVQHAEEWSEFMQKLSSNGHGEIAYESIACIWFIYSTAEETARNHLLLPELDTVVIMIQQ